jgi:hypothetical protein
MLRRFVQSLPLGVLIGVGVAVTAAERVTVITHNGQRTSGVVASHGRSGENREGSSLTVTTDNGQQRRIQLDDVAVIDFAGDAPPESELQSLPSGSTNVLVLRNGQREQGTFVDMYGGETLKFRSQSGTQDYAIRDVSRIYIAPQAARTAFNVAPSAAVATSGTGIALGTVRVDARQPWTDTGITVNAGDRLVFNASGQIAFGKGPGQTADPNGNAAERRANYPDPAVPVGALIGRIGNSAPFAIGMQTQPLGMPASGRLMLGINDNELGDNSGFYSVTVSRP